MTTKNPRWEYRRLRRGTVSGYQNNCDKHCKNERFLTIGPLSEHPEFNLHRAVLILEWGWNLTDPAMSHG